MIGHFMFDYEVQVRERGKLSRTFVIQASTGSEAGDLAEEKMLAMDKSIKPAPVMLSIKAGKEGSEPKWLKTEWTGLEFAVRRVSDLAGRDLTLN